MISFSGGVSDSCLFIIWKIQEKILDLSLFIYFFLNSEFVNFKLGKERNPAPREKHQYMLGGSCMESKLPEKKPQSATDLHVECGQAEYPHSQEDSWDPGVH